MSNTYTTSSSTSTGGWKITTVGTTTGTNTADITWSDAQKAKYNLEGLPEYGISTEEPKRLVPLIHCSACGASFEDNPWRKKCIAFVAEIRKIRTARDLVKAYGKIGIEELFMPVPYSLSEVCGNCYNRAKISKETLRCIPVKRNKKAFDNQCRKYGVLTHEQALEKKRREDRMFASVLTRIDDPVKRTVTYSSSSGKSITWSEEGFNAMAKTDMGVAELECKIMELVDEVDLKRLDQLIRYGELESQLIQDRKNNSRKGKI